MLTYDLIHAVLQGLPTSLLVHLGDPGLLFCERMQFAVQNQVPPAHALKYALEEASQADRIALVRIFKIINSVMALPDLTRRQKEALIALRSHGRISCGKLSRLLTQDRSHTHKRLAVLVEKGYAAKYVGLNGVSYFAKSPAPQKPIRSELDAIMSSLIERVETGDLSRSPRHVISATTKGDSVARSCEEALPAAPTKQSPAASATLATSALAATSATAPTEKSIYKSYSPLGGKQ
jgi:hypothetical protein